ncbi:MAG: starch-binding protein [Sphingobacteriales bacterium]|nr:starch-binding protein [Sphingobacteriales bacterium]
MLPTTYGIRVVLDIVLNHVGYDNTADSQTYNLGAVSNPTDPLWCNWWTDNNGVPWIRKGDGTQYCAVASGGDDLTMALAGLPDIRTNYTTAVGLPKVLQTKWNSTKEAQELAELNTFFNNTTLTATPSNHLIKWLTDWVRQYGVDGFRIDTYKHVERAIWGELKDQANDAFAEWKTNNPAKKLDDNDFWMVGEWYGHGPGKNTEAVTVGKTDALINFNFQSQAATPTALNSTYANYAAIVNPDPEWNILSYISSHDTYLFDRNDLIDGGTSLLLAPGAVQIFYGDESARPTLSYNTGTDQDTRSFMNWSSINNTVLNHWKKLGKFRKKHPAIGAGTHTLIQATSPYIFKREYQNTAAGVCDVALIALGTGSGAVTLNVSGTFANGTLLRNYYTGATATVSNGQVTFTVGSEQLLLIEAVNNLPCLLVDISPDICSSDTPVQVTISAADGNNPNTTPAIYYTFDANANPANLSQWTLYSAPFTLSQSQTVYTFAQNTAGEQSEVLSQEFVINEVPSITIHWNAAAANCSNPKIYIWDINGIPNTAPAAWPGLSMSDPDGDGWYEYTLVNACFANVIFSCNGANQTADLRVSGDACYDNGWLSTCPDFPPATYIAPNGGNYGVGFLDVSIVSTGNNCYTYYTTDGTAPTAASTPYNGAFSLNGYAGSSYTVQAVSYCGNDTSNIATQTYTFADGITLYWNSNGTCNTPYIYAWNLNGVSGTNIGAWPGKLMSDPDGDGWFEYSIAGANCVNVIFNCGSNQNQTSDQLNICADSCFQGTTAAGAWVACPTSVAACPEDLTLNTTPIAADTYSVQEVIFSAGSVNSGTTVHFEAGEAIVLMNNFAAVAGSNFRANITACGGGNKTKALNNGIALGANSAADVFIAPNPAREMALLYLRQLQNETLQVRLSDLSGRLLYFTNPSTVDSELQTIALPLSGLPQGLYIVQIQGKNFYKTIKLQILY